MASRTGSRGVPAFKTLYNRFTGDGTDITLSVTAQAMLLLGAGPGMADAWLTHLAGADDPLRDFEQMWKVNLAVLPWLDGYLDPLTGWLEQAPPGRADQVRHVAAAYHDVDFHRLVDDVPNSGDWLGPLYTELRGKHSQSSKGAFFTPMVLCMSMGLMLDPDEGQRILDPCCGTGAMLVGAARAMRKNGKDPSTCLWAANDIDPMAVALAGVQMTAHGMGPHIWLTVGDGLLYGMGVDGDPQHQRPWWERDRVRAGLPLEQEESDGARGAA